MRLLSLSVLTFVLFQSPQTPTGAIQGLAVRIGTNEPLAGAEVMLDQLTELGISRVQQVKTDGEGHFAASDLPVGRYLVVVTKSGYAAQVFGARQTGVAGLAAVGTRESEISAVGSLVDVAMNEVRNLVIPMTPSGTLSGRVLGADGQPLVAMQVDLLPLTYSFAGKRYWIPLSQVDTNDRGEYRLYNVEPGRYYVCARWTQMAISRQEVNSEVRVVDAQDSNGRRYPLTCYPGSPTVARASIVDVRAGETVSGIDVVMRSTGQRLLRKIRGRVVDSETGRLITSELAPFFALIPQESDYLVSVPTIDPHLTSEGNFELRDIPEGRYWLAVRFAVPTTSPVQSSRIAVLPVEVLGGDVEGVMVNATPTVTVLGKATLNGAPWSTADSDRFQVQLTSNRFGAYAPSVTSNPSPAFFDLDGTFSILEAGPGEYDLVFSGLPPDAYVKEARYGDIDALTEKISIAGTSVASLEIAVSTESGQLTGSVSDRTDKPINNVEVVLIPDDATRRPDRYRTARTDENGHFLLRGIAPGPYKLYSWESIERFGYFDTDFVSRYEALGKNVRISEGPNEAVSLEMIPADLPR